MRKIKMTMMFLLVNLMVCLNFTLEINASTYINDV